MKTHEKLTEIYINHETLLNITITHCKLLKLYKTIENHAKSTDIAKPTGNPENKANATHSHEN